MRQQACSEPRIGQFAEADLDVETLLDQVDRAIAQVRAGEGLHLKPLLGGLDPAVSWESLRVIEEHVLPRLAQEYSRIELPAAAREIGSVSKTSKLTSALVNGSYEAPMSYAELRSHFDRTTTEQGWYVCREKHMYDWFRDLGGMMMTYCKGEIRANLQYAGERAQEVGYNWTFAFGVSWGMD